MSFNVLVVEDEPLARSLIIRALRQSGLTLKAVFEAENGARGLEVLQAQNIDFVLLDVHMPEMNGKEMVRRMREIPDFENIPVVFITGDLKDEAADEPVEKGIGFVRKPFDPNTLGETVMNLLSS